MYPNLSKSIRTGRPFWFPAALALVALGLNQAALADTDNTGTGGTISYTDSSGLNPRSSPPYALGYVVHAYTAIGADTLNVPVAVTADVLAVGGGGGGGGTIAGGGGAGGLIYTNLAVSAGLTSVVVGAGGAGNPANGWKQGSNGANSSFGASVIANGGGGGGGWNATAALAGGSGGGGVNGAAGGSFTSGQGHAGGGSGGNSAGGGGGAGAVGTNGVAGTQSGNGGAGLANAISGLSTWYAGGGGGGGGNGSAAGAGGTGGGGAGSPPNSNITAASGVANTGGGGGGGSYNPTPAGGNGGSGVVIVRYPYASLSLSVMVASPTANQVFPNGSPISATAAVLSGTPPYQVKFFTDTAGSGFVQIGSTLSGSGPTFDQAIGSPSNGTYHIYATVTDSVAATASSVGNPTSFTVTTPVATTTTLNSSANPSTYPQAVMYTATVLDAHSTPPSGGTVQFYAGGNPLGSPVAVNASTGIAKYSPGLLPATTYSVMAHFSGSSQYLASDSPTLSQYVNQALLTVTPDNKVRAPGNANPLFTYKITGYQNGENATSAGITGVPDLSCPLAPDGTTSEGSFPITGTPGSLSAANYSFTTVNGTLTVMAGAPPVPSGMTCWYDAANGVAPGGNGVVVTTWNDLSGNAHHARKASGSPTLVTNQVNGRPAIQLRSSHFNCDGALFTAQQYLVMISPTSTWSGGGCFMGPAGDGTYRIYDMFSGTWAGAPGCYAGFWRDPDPLGVSRDGNVVTPQTGNNFIYPLHPPEINAQYFILKINVNTTAKTNAGKAGTYQIGKGADVGYINFDVAEIIGYDSILSSDDEKKVGRYLADKYAITAANYPLINPPSAPTLAATSLPHSIKLDWTPTYSATSYNVYRGRSSGVYDPTPITSLAAGTVTYTDLTATAAAPPYFYAVKSVNSIGEGAASNEVSGAATSGLASQSIAFGSLPSKTYGDAPFQISATASPSSLPVSFTSSDESVGSVSGTTVTILKAGTVTITATQPGDGNFYPATPVDQPLTISTANQTLTLTLGSRLVRGSDSSPFADPATTTKPSGNPVTYSSSNENVATVDASGTVTIVAVGTTQILANQAELPEYYNAAPQVSQSIIVIAPVLPVNNGLACWYDAGQGVTESGGVVQSWADQSGLGHYATRGGGTPTLALNQINGRPAIQFRTSWFNVPGALFTAEQYLVLKAPGTTWSNSGCFMGPTDPTFTGAGDFRYWRIYDMAGNNDCFWGDPPPIAVSKNGAPISPQFGANVGYHIPPINQYMILKIDVNTTTYGGARSPANYQIGKAADVGTVDFDVAEIICYDHVLSSNEASTMTAYLTNKYIASVLTYSDWATTKYNGYDLSDPTADLDGDGMSNFAEYAFGLNPISGASVNPLSPLLGKTFNYSRTSNTGLTYTVWHSTNLQNWFSDHTTQGNATSIGDGVESVPVTLDDILLTNPTLYLRVTAQ